MTDKRLRVGHRETIRLAGFPGRGGAQVSFLPTAICEDACGARPSPGHRTDAEGDAEFRVTVPRTFIGEHHRPVYFRDGERIDVEVTWEGAGHSFAVTSVRPEPILIRVHGPGHD